MGVNKAILLGNVGKDPQIKHLDDGTAVCSFPMATNERYRDRNGERKEVTEWHNIDLWGKLAEIANEYVKKGTQIYLEGKIQTRQYTDKEGNKKYITEVVGNNLELLSRSAGGSGGGEANDAYNTSNLAGAGKSNTSEAEPKSSGGDADFDTQGGNDDDLPF